MWIWLALGALVLLSAGLCNALVSRKNGVDYAFGGVDATLKKRYDLIPNLVAAVEATMQHERELLTQITQLRTEALRSSGEKRMNVDKRLTLQLHGLMLAVENYPDLKANQNFLHLQAALDEIEDQISAARRAFNAAVTDYNNAVEMFPINLMAVVLGYQRKTAFEIPELERENLDVRALLQR